MDATVNRLLAKAGTTFADEAGITLKNTASPLYRLLVVSVLLSTRIKSEIAVSALRELVRSGYGSAKAMREATWQHRVDALGRAHYRRYDESTSTALGEGAQLLLDKYGGDLRKLRREAGEDPARIRELLQEVPRLGPVGAEIFCREAQAVWPELRPTLDRKAKQGAELIGLPKDRKRLADLVPDDELARFAAALVRVALDRQLAPAITEAG